MELARRECLGTWLLATNFDPAAVQFTTRPTKWHQNHMYQAAAPVFEQALTKLTDNKGEDQLMWQRVTTDQAGMAYGLAGNLAKARAIFESAVAKDPQYPMYYYNLACADAEEKKLA